jgi:hypothetical protein
MILSAIGGSGPRRSQISCHFFLLEATSSSGGQAHLLIRTLGDSGMETSIAKRLGAVFSVFSFFVTILAGFFSLTPTSVEAELAFHDSTKLEMEQLATSDETEQNIRVALAH